MFDAKRVDWPYQRQQLSPRTLPFIHGEWVRASGETLTLISPRDGSALAEISGASAADVDAAVRSARAAFESGVWSALAPRERGQRLLAFAQLIHDHAAELALLVSLEMGKPLREALQIELRAVVNCFRWYGEAADKLIDETPVTSPDSLALVTREPAGVVAAVVPWNFPLTMAAWKLGPALAAGNSVVLKPAEHTSCSALRLGELAFEAGIPAGVLNVIPGRGGVAGRALGEHPDVDVITFTGSTGVGRELLEYSARSSSASPRRVFRKMIRDMIGADILPDYTLSEEAGDVIRVAPREVLERASSGLAGRSLPPLSTTVLEKARALAPGWDIYALEADWRAYWQATGRARLASPGKAFLGYIRVRVDAVE